jgi:hypothetical protein
VSARARRSASMRTTKTCGPDPPTLPDAGIKFVDDGDAVPHGTDTPRPASDGGYQSPDTGESTL